MIRQAEEKDVHAVYSLICLLENKEMNETLFQSKYLESLKNENIYFFVYEQEDKIKGFISLYVKSYLHHDQKTGEISELIVDEKERNQKIGEALIQYVETIAKEIHLEELELCTSTWRKDAHRFYEKHGFIMNHYNYIQKLEYND